MQVDVNGTSPPVVVTRQQQQARLQHKLQMQQEKAEALAAAPMTEERSKENFLSCLGLVTKSALTEIQNKKTERKRRTTANPQFSNAAIEAKRITAMETAAKRQRRREAALAASEEVRNPRAAKERPQLPTFRRVSNEEPVRPVKSVTKSLMLADNKQNSRKQDLSNSASLLKPKSESVPPIKPPVSPRCFSCSEHCDPGLDVVIYCSSCRLLFHATCAALVEDIIETGTLPCPSCDRERKMSEEIGDAETFEKLTQSKKLQLNGKVKSEPGVHVANKCDLRVHFGTKQRERRHLLHTKSYMERTHNENRKILSDLKENLKLAKEQQEVLVRSREELNRKITELTGSDATAKMKEFIESNSQPLSQVNKKENGFPPEAVPRGDLMSLKEQPMQQNGSIIKIPIPTIKSNIIKEINANTELPSIEPNKNCKTYSKSPAVGNQSSSSTSGLPTVPEVVLTNGQAQPILVTITPPEAIPEKQVGDQLPSQCLEETNAAVASIELTREEEEDDVMDDIDLVVASEPSPVDIQRVELMEVDTVS
ncbi:hypothetical protein HDE_00292 [Halotydeus destructor]|nr:hypothetical protein HDE_00292 [Halotydeus destructor]